MAKPSTPRSNPRAYAFALIPAGFVLLVVVLWLMGWWEEDVTPAPEETVENAITVPDE